VNLARALTTTALVACIGVAPSVGGDARIDALAETALAGKTASGVSVTVARDGTIVYAHGFGTRERGGSAPVDAATRFPIGSITKQFTAAAIALLARDGRLSFDAPLVTYLHDAPHAKDVTIRELLQQTAGYANFTSQPVFLRTMTTSTTLTPRDLIATIASEPLDFPPGTHFEYSNTNYVILGAVIEAVTKQSYATVIHERIAAPLGLTTLTFGPPSDTKDVVVSTWSAEAASAAGGLYASPADIARWDAAFFGGKLLPLATVREMTTPPKIAGASLPYAFGWIADTLEGRTQIWHNGGVPGANTRNSWFPDTHTAVVVFGNDVAFDPGPTVRDTMRVIDPPSAAALAEQRAPSPNEDAAVTATAKRVFAAWASRTVDAAGYAGAMRSAITPELVARVAADLTAGGTPTVFIFRGTATQAGSTYYRYRVETTTNAVWAMALSLDASGLVTGVVFTPL
jgi:CubicO group peptidase (beta-lactamase class C family)